MRAVWSRLGLWAAGPVLATVAVTGVAEARPTRCAALAGASVPPAAIGLPTGGAVVDSARIYPASSDAPVCVVLGHIHAHHAGSPDIRFALNLPERWNGKAVQLGGGGFNGVLVDGRSVPFLPGAVKSRTDPSALPGVDITASGYATFGSDSGHQWDGKSDPLAFARDDEALRNYGGDAIGKVRDATAWLIRLRYGRSPTRTYFYGGSKGGQEALAAAQRWPDKYNGIVVFFPGYDFAAQFYASFYLLKAPLIDNAALAQISRATIEACDPLDGVTDGLVANVAACRAAFRPETLLCVDRAAPDCLTQPQLEALADLTRPKAIGFALGGVTRWPGWALFDGVPAGALVQLLGNRAAGVRGMVALSSRNMILKDPQADTSTFDPAAHAEAFRRLSGVLDAASTNLDRFRARGGKLILIQGTVDTVVPPDNTVAFWTRLQKRYNRVLGHFARFYMVPGFGHATGAFVPAWDSLSALDAWVGKGVAPGAVIATNAAPGGTGRSRPLCQYPAWPRYVAGDPDAASSFQCTSAGAR